MLLGSGRAFSLFFQVIRVASDNDVLVPTKGVFEFETHLIVQDILPRFIGDKLGDEDSDCIVLFLSFLGNPFDILDSRGDDVAVAGLDIFQSNGWEVIGKFLENFLIFFCCFLGRNMHG